MGSVGDGQHIKEKSLQQDSNLFDVLKILREAKRKKSKCTDEKYKRFSMNNFEELKNSMAEFPEQFPKTHEDKSNTQTDDSHLSKSIETILYYPISLIQKCNILQDLLT